MSPDVPSDQKPVSKLPVLLSVAAVLLLAALDQTIVATALPTIVADLGGLDQLSWVVTAYLLTSTVVAPIYGKLGDLYGRKAIIQAAITLFLAGSILAGFSTSMMMLIGARALQGLGGGGLFVLALTVVADIVAPRQRGRIQGLFGAVFGLSSIAGPLLGGFFVEQLSWRWVFFVNLPLGLIAMVVLGYAFTAKVKTVRHKIDYLGALLLSVLLASLVLATSLGGSVLPWQSPLLIGLILLIPASLAAFIFVESRASEPVLPLALFANKVFVVSVSLGAVLGISMMGGVTFLPLFLQVVKGSSPTISGLQMVPMMLGMLVGSMGAGQFMTRTGRYKIMPVAGTIILIPGFLLFSTLDQQTSGWLISLFMFLVGLGMGPMMSVITTAIQNAVPRHLLGVATAGSTMFRQIGGSLGVALFGAVFSARLVAELGQKLPEGTNIAELGAQSVAAMPPELRETVLGGFTSALQPIFLLATVTAVIGLLLALLLKEIPLRSSEDEPTDASGDAKTPVSADR